MVRGSSVLRGCSLGRRLRVFIAACLKNWLTGVVLLILMRQQQVLAGIPAVVNPLPIFNTSPLRYWSLS